MRTVSALAQPTVCALTGFKTAHDAFDAVPHKHIPRDGNIVRYGQLLGSFRRNLLLNSVMFFYDALDVQQAVYNN